MSSAADAITQLIYLYAERLDAGDFEGVAQLFEHATFRSNSRPEVRSGSAEVLAVYRNTVATFENGTPCTKHVTTNVIVDLADDQQSATARSYFTVLQARPELPLQTIIAGRYHDSFAVIAGAWCFTDRLVLVDLVGDLRFHLKRPVGLA